MCGQDKQAVTTEDLNVLRAELATEIHRLEQDAAQRMKEKDCAELQKLKTERDKARRDNSWWWRSFQVIAWLLPGLAFIIGILSILNVYEDNQQDKLRLLLRDLGSQEQSVRLSAVSRLFTYSPERRRIGQLANAIFGSTSSGEIEEQLVNTITAALRLEDNLTVKQSIFLLLEKNYPTRAGPLLAILRNDLIRSLKQEQIPPPKKFWDNQRQTLLLTAVSLVSLGLTSKGWFRRASQAATGASRT